MRRCRRRRARRRRTCRPTRGTPASASRAAADITALPVAVDPVNETRSTRGSSASCAPNRWSLDVTTLTTPGGMSVCSATARASAAAAHGVSGAGLSTTVQPAASAGPTLARLIWCGKFHGVIAPTTPAGSRSTQRCDATPIGFASPRSVRQPSYDSARSAIHPRSATGESNCGPAVRNAGAPTSAVVNARSSSPWRCSASRSWRRHRARNDASVRPRRPRRTRVALHRSRRPCRRRCRRRRHRAPPRWPD